MWMRKIKNVKIFPFNRYNLVQDNLGRFSPFYRPRRLVGWVGVYFHSF
jgi:hypothetical protein